MTLTQLPLWVKKLGFMILHPRSYVLSQKTQLLRRQYRLKSHKGDPIVASFSSGVSVRLWPKGEIAQLVYTSAFEHDLISAVIKFLKPGMTVVDVGANCGLYSLIAAQCVGKSGAVWAFEPASDMVRLFRDNQKLNATKSVKLFKLALGDKKNQKVTLACEPGRGDGYRYVRYSKKSTKKELDRMVEVVAGSMLDFVWAKQGKPKVDFIKIDVEGGELKVLRGAQKVLTNHPDLVILMENSAFGLSRVGDDQSSLYAFMASLGYSFYAWNQVHRDWDNTTDFISQAGNVWVTRQINLLPKVSLR